jgi:hypothetical protein
MKLEQRLRRIELILSLCPENASRPECRTILDLPKETVVEAFAIHKELFGGYHLILAENPTAEDIERLSIINELMPEEFYDLMVRHGYEMEAEK